MIIVYQSLESGPSKKEGLSAITAFINKLFKAQVALNLANLYGTGFDKTNDQWSMNVNEKHYVMEQKKINLKKLDHGKQEMEIEKEVTIQKEINQSRKVKVARCKEKIKKDGKGKKDVKDVKDDYDEFFNLKSLKQLYSKMDDKSIAIMLLSLIIDSIKKSVNKTTLKSYVTFDESTKQEYKIPGFTKDPDIIIFGEVYGADIKDEVISGYKVVYGIDPTGDARHRFTVLQKVVGADALVDLDIEIVTNSDKVNSKDHTNYKAMMIRARGHLIACVHIPNSICDDENLAAQYLKNNLGEAKQINSCIKGLDGIMGDTNQPAWNFINEKVMPEFKVDLNDKITTSIMNNKQQLIHCFDGQSRLTDGTNSNYQAHYDFASFIGSGARIDDTGSVYNGDEKLQDLSYLYHGLTGKHIEINNKLYAYSDHDGVIVELLKDKIDHFLAQKNANKAKIVAENIKPISQISQNEQISCFKQRLDDIDSNLETTDFFKNFENACQNQFQAAKELWVLNLVNGTGRVHIDSGMGRVDVDHLDFDKLAEESLKKSEVEYAQQSWILNYIEDEANIRKNLQKHPPLSRKDNQNKLEKSREIFENKYKEKGLKKFGFTPLTPNETKNVERKVKVMLNNQTDEILSLKQKANKISSMYRKFENDYKNFKSKHTDGKLDSEFEAIDSKFKGIDFKYKIFDSQAQKKVKK